MNCPACIARGGQTWHGSAPRCAFVKGRFSGDNWNCAGLDDLRELVYEGQELPHGVDYQYCDDYKYATINVSHIEALNGALAMWVCWYKSRGTTDKVLLLYSDEPPRPPTYEEVVAVVSAFRKEVV